MEFIHLLPFLITPTESFGLSPGSLFGARFYPIQGWHAHSILFQERPFYSFPRPAGIFLKSFPIIMAYLMFQVPLALAFSHNTPDSLMRQRLFVLTGGGQNS